GCVNVLLSMGHLEVAPSHDDAWLRAIGPITAMLLRAPAETRLLGVATPVNAAEERSRLVAALEAGRAEMPRWEYAPRQSAPALRRALEDAARALAHVDAPLAGAYAARARELADEAELAESVGTPALAAKARARFAGAEDARAIAEAWAHEEAAAGGE